MIPGKKVSYTLKSVTETQDAGGSATLTIATVCTFKGSTMAPLTLYENSLFEKQTTVGRYRIIADYDQFGAAYYASIEESEENIITYNSTNYDIIRVNEFEGIPGHHYEIYVEKKR